MDFFIGRAAQAGDLFPLVRETDSIGKSQKTKEKYSSQ